MARNKNNLKKIEDFAERTGMMKPRSLSDDDIADIQRTIDAAWIKSKSNPKVRSDEEGLQILRGLIDAETNADKKEFHERIFGIATRLAHRKKPLSVSGGASQSDSVSDVLPLHERIKFLRERLN